MVMFLYCAKLDECFYENLTNIYESRPCHIWEFINKYIHRCGAMCLTKSVFKLLDKMPADSWCSLEEFILYRYKPED